MRDFKFLGLEFNNIDFKGAISELESYIHNGKSHSVYTISIELAVLANANQNFKGLYDKADLLFIDSFGLCYIAKLFGKPVREPVNAARLMFAFLEIARAKGYRIYLLGAKDEVLKKAVENIRIKYPGIQIAGWHHGYFNQDAPNDVVEDIKTKKPDVLFVAMTSPLKENFIGNYGKKTGVPVCIGVGGSIDVLAGKCCLAPLWVSKAGMEWLFRFIQEPRRMWKRYIITNTRFVFLLFRETINTFAAWISLLFR